MDAVYPSPMQLCGRDLPWVQHATHLGHELHQMCNMEFDANIKRAQFIECSVKIQESFGFARPNEILQAIHTYAGHWYGSMLWDLFGEKAGQIYRSWSTAVKLTWDVPRSTHTFLVHVSWLLTCQLSSSSFWVDMWTLSRSSSAASAQRLGLWPTWWPGVPGPTLAKIFLTLRERQTWTLCHLILGWSEMQWRESRLHQLKDGDGSILPNFFMPGGNW